MTDYQKSFKTGRNILNHNQIQKHLNLNNKFSQTENNLNIEFMLSDSKVRQAGFIRNNSSRKIIFKPEPQVKNLQSDDSFSSFQYQSTGKPPLKDADKNSGKINEIRMKNQANLKPQKSYESASRQVVKQPQPNIPKPAYKATQQPTFQNQRLKNNFFQQPKKSSTMNQAQQLSRTSTPYFMEKSMKQDLEEVNNICNRIGNMKLEGNFSFNPKLNNRMIKNKGNLEWESNEEERQHIVERKNQSNLIRGSQEFEQAVRKTKQNNYFCNVNSSSSNRFEYDFESSSGDEEDSENQNHSQIEEETQRQNTERDAQIVRYYQEQQRQRTEPSGMAKTKLRLNSPNNIGQITNYRPYPQQDNQPHAQKSSNRSRRAQNQKQAQNQQELITEYKKDDFGAKIPTYMKSKNQQLAEKKGYQNIIDPQEGVIATNGGMCFNVDVKQFSQNASVMDSRPVKRGNINQKKKKINQKQEMLKRREMAKVYSKQARFRLFGFA